MDEMMQRQYRDGKRKRGESGRGGEGKRGEGERGREESGGRGGREREREIEREREGGGVETPQQRKRLGIYSGSSSYFVLIINHCLDHSIHKTMDHNNHYNLQIQRDKGF